MIEKVLPDEAVGVEAFDDPPEAFLYPQEQAVVSRAVGRRRREFRAVRHCARRAMRELGCAPVPLLPGERGMPLWPPGVVGSMTHCPGYRAAAVGHVGDLIAIGVDAEPHDMLPPDVMVHVALREEQARLTELATVAEEICWDRVLFCIKEATYKAWFPLTRSRLGFRDVAVRISSDTSGAATGDFCVRVLVAGQSTAGEPVTRFSGRWLVGGGLVLAAVATPCTRWGSSQSRASSFGV